MNLPNTLTIARLFLIPVYLFVFFSDFESKSLLAFAVLFLAGLTDIADGYFARKYKLSTELGVILDPLADKMFMISVLGSFIISGTISWWAAGSVVVRDLSMIIGSAVSQVRMGKILPANMYGKLTTLLFYVSFFLLILESPIGQLFLWCIILFSFVTSTFYLAEYKKMSRLQHEI
ncbi:CDP-alcohol phosphatidyltransferase family protein [Effusibacillus consociatus]|uniref:CDP-diacylglycerol--glycerol-3-phosphate 3-phosphatidyltransferase n=1 Tax=Effusibacillus consociatus TaxID=1117041 RepID=A0ABV9PWZ0_9BACL